MTVHSCVDLSVWEATLSRARPPTFLQSWAWGETQRALGEDVIRLVASAGATVQGILQAVTVTARRGTFLHVPHGPVADDTSVTRALLGAARREAERRHLAFLRVSPIQEASDASLGLYRALGFRPAPIHLHAERLWVLDLASPEEKLLAGMRKTTRNLIRRAERDGISVHLSPAPDVLETFMTLYRETANRERFIPFPRVTIAAEIASFSAQNGAVIARALYRDTPVAAAVALFTPWSGFYHHGASSRRFSHIPGSTALQWALIREATRRGCSTYNFWGIAGEERHPWAGLTLFKKGFGGREVRLQPTVDLPLSLRYWPAYCVDRSRRWFRGV